MTDLLHVLALVK